MDELRRAEILIEESRAVLRQLSALFEHTKPIYGWDHPYGQRSQDVVGSLCIRLDKWMDDRKETVAKERERKANDT